MSTIGNSSVESKPDLFSALCVGDKVSSFRALLRRYTYFVQQPNNQIEGFALSRDNACIVPDYIPIRNNSGTALIYADAFTVIGSCYAMRRGGIRLRVTYDKGNFEIIGNTIQQINARLALNDIVTGPFPVASNIDMFQANIEQNLMHGNTISVEIPQYTKTYSTATLDAMGAADSTYPFHLDYTAGKNSSVSRVSLGLHRPSGLNPLAQTAPTPFRRFALVSRAMADDGEFMTFISVPVMLLDETSVTIGYQGNL
jgi:hypothetical protein